MSCMHLLSSRSLESSLPATRRHARHLVTLPALHPYALQHSDCVIVILSVTRSNAPALVGAVVWVCILAKIARQY
jgi:hypothetical protein